MKPRTRARTLSLEVLYEFDVANHNALTVLSRRVHEEAIETIDDQKDNQQRDERDIESEKLNPETIQFASELVGGVVDKLSSLDEIISRFAPEWPIDQIAIIDRNILRIAIYELLHTHESHELIAIIEAVELAKSYGSESSRRFVHGVLGAFMGELGIPHFETPQKLNQSHRMPPKKSKNGVKKDVVREAILEAVMGD